MADAVKTWADPCLKLLVVALLEEAGERPLDTVKSVLVMEPVSIYTYVLNEMQT